MEYRVDVLESVPQAVLRLWWEMRPDRAGADIAAGMRELSAVTRRAGLTACGAVTITYPGESVPDGATRVDLGVPVDLGTALGPRSGAEVLVQPGGLVARTCHRGGYDGLGAAYRALRESLRESGYRPNGPPTEAYLVGPDEVGDPALLVTEIRIPVVPAPALTAYVHTPFAETVPLVERALERHGFEPVAAVDMRSLLDAGAGLPIDERVVLVVCHPGLAGQMIAADPGSGWMSSHIVTVRDTGAGIAIEVADPAVLAEPSDPILREMAGQLRKLLSGALDMLREEGRDRAAGRGAGIRH